MAISIAINGSVTLDESFGLQFGGGGNAHEDNDDSDVLLSTLPTAFSDRLFLDLALDDQFADDNGVAHSAPNYISLSGTGSVVSLGFTTTSGGALPVYGGLDPGAACNLTALDGGAITLFADSLLGNRLVYGVDTQGDIVFAMYMDVASDLLSASVWMVQFEALNNTDANNHDDPLTLTGLGVGAGTTTEFNFNELPSGANLFGMLGSGTSGLIVFGTTTVLKADHTYKNPGSDVIQTSQAGENATIGVNSQMFDVGDSAYFTYVKNPNANYTSSNLSPNEADDADNLLYGDGVPATNDTIEASSAFLEVAQIQSGVVASMSITAYNITGSPQGTNLLDGSGQNAVAVTRVIVYAADGTTVLDDSNDPAGDNPNISFSFNGGVATVTGFEAGYRIEWYTSAPHDQVKISGLNGKFDIGGFGVSEPTAVSAPLSGVRFEDDGPSISATIVGAPSPTVDESNLAANDSDSFAAQFSPLFGTDGAADATPVTYALSTPGGASGLLDTATGQSIVLSLVGGVIQGRTAISNELCFTVSVDGSGNVTLDQLRAVVHPTADPDESKTLASAGLVVLTATAHDKDGDSASAPLDIGTQLIFKDDGPSISATIDGAPSPTVDESNLADDDSDSFAAQFSPVYGADGQGATPVTYALSTPGGDSGLFDTATGESIILSLVGGVIQGRSAISDDLCFTVSVDGSGNVTLDQIRAVVHPTADPDESKTLDSADLVVLTATAHDKDGDSASAPLNIGTQLIFKDDGPVVDIELNGTPLVTVDESTLPVSDSMLASELLTISDDFGADGEGAVDPVYELLLGDPNSGLFDTLTGLEVILSINGDGTLITGQVDDNGTLETVFTIGLDPATGEVTLTQMRAMKHDNSDDPDESTSPLVFDDPNTVQIQRTITDGDNDSDSDAVDISAIFEFRDDGPSLGPAAEDGIDLLTDDTNILDTASRTTVELFPLAPDFGNDGENALTPILYSLVLTTENGLTDLVDTATGKPILLVTEGDDVVGYVDEDDSGTIEAGETLEAIRYTIVAIPGEDVEKQVDFIQSRAVFHDTALPETVGDGLVSIEQVAIDGDGDISDVEDVDLGAITFISDDEPSIGPIANGVVDFAAGDTVNNDLNGVVGNDPNSSPYKITNYTATLTVDGVELHGILSDGDTKVTYYADDDGVAGYGTPGDTAYYKLELGDQGGEGDYTFTVLVDPQNPTTEFNFDSLPSGSNLFGIVGDADAGLIIFGRDIVLKADNTYIANQTQEIKTSQAGIHDTIGIESQMFDPGDAAYFTFVSDPDPNFTGTALGSTEADDADNILYGATLENESAFIRIAQLQGNNAPSMSIQLFNIDDTPQGVDMIDERGTNAAGKDPDVTAVRVFAADGTTLLESFSGGVEAGLSDTITISINGDGVATVTGFGTNYKIEWDADEDFDQTLITGVAGKFDIGGFGFTQGNDSPDQVLEFTALVTDGDGDTDGGTGDVEASWKIGIDGTGIFDDDFVEGVSII